MMIYFSFDAMFSGSIRITLGHPVLRKVMRLVMKARQPASFTGPPTVPAPSVKLEQLDG
jgi:hypothetical protein